MRRNPSPEVGRSETTAELIARISAERDAPLRSTGRHSVITAPPRTAAAPRVARPRRPAAARAVSDTDPRMSAYRPSARVRDDEPSELRTGPIDLRGLTDTVPPQPVGAPQQVRTPQEVAAPQRVDTPPRAAAPRPRRERALAAVDDLPHTPAPEPFVAPDTPRRPLRLAVSAALVAVAMVVVGAAAAGWFGGTGGTEAPADLGAVTAPAAGVVPEPAATGPTVPEPVNGPAADAAPPAGDVQPTGAAEPPPADPYGY